LALFVATVATGAVLPAHPDASPMKSSPAINFIALQL
jgi:hypothetical protein